MPMLISWMQKKASFVAKRKSQARRHVDAGADAAALDAGDDRHARFLEAVKSALQGWRSRMNFSARR